MNSIQNSPCRLSPSFQLVEVECSVLLLQKHGALFESEYPLFHSGLWMPRQRKITDFSLLTLFQQSLVLSMVTSGSISVDPLQKLNFLYDFRVVVDFLSAFSRTLIIHVALLLLVHEYRNVLRKSAKPHILNSIPPWSLVSKFLLFLSLLSIPLGKNECLNR